MAIPTTGVTGATAYSPTSAWNASITLIGDSESMIGENASGETATLNRSEKQLAQNSKYLYDLTTHAAVTTSIYTLGSSTDFNTYLAQYSRQIQRHRLTLTLQENLTMNAAYDEFFAFNYLCNFQEIIIDLNNKAITCDATYGIYPALFYFYNCMSPKITLKDGTIICTADDKISSVAKFENCIGQILVYNVDTDLHKDIDHYNFIGSSGIVENCNMTLGKSGVYAQELSQVYVKGVVSLVKCDDYGLFATSGSTIKKYATNAANVPQGNISDENATYGGVIV